MKRVVLVTLGLSILLVFAVGMNVRNSRETTTGLASLITKDVARDANDAPADLGEQGLPDIKKTLVEQREAIETTISEQVEKKRRVGEEKKKVIEKELWKTIIPDRAKEFICSSP